MTPVLDLCNDIHSDCLSFDSIVSLKDAKKVLKHHVLMGNVSTYALEYSDSEKIQKLAKISVNNGSNILSPACGIGMRSPLENLKSIITASKNYDYEDKNK